mgnify:FL=1
MSFSFNCTYCGKKLVAQPSMGGQQRTCPQCRATLTVPTAPHPDATPPTVSHSAADHHLLLVPPHNREQENLIDMTAMVDIVFFLLIFFMVTSIQALQSVMEMPPPQASSDSASAQVAPDFANDPSSITISIEADDTIWIEGKQVYGGQELRVKLRQLRKENIQLNGMMVLGDPEASHGILVMVLDAGADAGMEDLRFSVAEEFEAFGG